MQEHSHCHHRYNHSNENYAFATEDGIEVLLAGGLVHKCTMCGHIDFPIEAKELLETNLKEKRKYPHAVRQLYIKLSDVI